MAQVRDWDALGSRRRRLMGWREAPGGYRQPTYPVARHFERAGAAGIEEDLAVVVQVLFSLFVAVAAAWFWPFRARPGLLTVGARPAAHMLVLGLTVLLIGIELVRIGSVIADAAQAATWTISSVAILLWAVIVAFGHPGYSLVLRLTGGPAGSR